MGTLEELGEKAIEYSRRGIYYSLGVLIALLKVLQKATEGLQRFSPYPALERRGVEFKDYLVLRAQVFTLGFLVLVILYIFDKLAGRSLVILGLVLGGPAVLSVLSLREHFSGYASYRDFFFSYLGISALLLTVKLVKPTVDFLFPQIHFVGIALAYILLFSYFFRTRYARNYTYGRVIEGGNTMKVKVNYDIASSIKPGIHLLKNDIQAKEGDRVKVAVSRGLLNLTGSKVIAVLEVIRD